MCVCQSDEDYETYDTVLELDEVLNLDTDTERAAYIQVISHTFITRSIPVLDLSTYIPGICIKAYCQCDRGSSPGGGGYLYGVIQARS